MSKINCASRTVQAATFVPVALPVGLVAGPFVGAGYLASQYIHNQTLQLWQQDKKAKAVASTLLVPFVAIGGAFVGLASGPMVVSEKIGEKASKCCAPPELDEEPIR